MGYKQSIFSIIYRAEFPKSISSRKMLRRIQTTSIKKRQILPLTIIKRESRAIRNFQKSIMKKSRYLKT